MAFTETLCDASSGVTSVSSQRLQHASLEVQTCTTKTRGVALYPLASKVYGLTAQLPTRDSFFIHTDLHSVDALVWYIDQETEGQLAR
jgi:hypothetical protein